MRSGRVFGQLISTSPGTAWQNRSNPTWKPPGKNGQKFRIYGSRESRNEKLRTAWELIAGQCARFCREGLNATGSGLFCVLINRFPADTKALCEYRLRCALSYPLE